MAKKEQTITNATDELRKLLVERKLTIVKLAEDCEDMTVECISTGFPQLDHILRTENGGIPRGRDIEIFSKQPEVGKAQPLSAKLKTPSGWTTIGDVQIGDPLASVDGAESTVEAIYPQGMRRVWKITFSDGRTVRCCGEHLWPIKKNHVWWHRMKLDYQLMNTYEIMADIQVAANRKRLSIPTVSGDFGCTDALPLSPELLGLMLGDGGMSDHGTPGYTTADPELVNRMNGLLKEYGCGLHQTSKYCYNVARTVSTRTSKGYPSANPVAQVLEDLHLLGKRSEEKWIPKEYLLADKSSRQSLLKGLLDTDGTATAKGAVQFCTSSLQLARDTEELVRSLGGMATVHGPRITKYTYNGKQRSGKKSYRVCVIMKNIGDVLGLGRKRSRVNLNKVNTPRLSIVSVEADGVEEMRCIKVSHPSHMYITDNYVVTHNTSLGLEMIRSAQAQGFRTAIFDLERTITTDYLHQIGIITDSQTDPLKTAVFMVRYAETTMPAEAILETLRQLSQLFDVILVDSVAALESKADLEKDAGEEGRLGGVSKMLSAFLRRNVAKRANVIWINQTRMKTGPSGPGGPGYVTTGGRGLPFWASIRISLELAFPNYKIQDTKDGPLLGTRVVLHTDKNKISPQYRNCTLAYLFNYSFSK